MTRLIRGARSFSHPALRGRLEIRKSNFRWGGFQRVGRPLPPCKRDQTPIGPGKGKARD